MRVWVTFSDEEYAYIQEKAREQGMTTQRYISNCTLMQVGLPVTVIQLEEVYKEVDKYLKSRKKNKTFICSDTVQSWGDLSRSDKMCVSKYIANIVQDDPERYEILKDGSDGHAKVYKVKK